MSLLMFIFLVKRSRVDPGKRGFKMALVEGRDWRRGETRGRPVLVRWQGREQSLTDWAKELDIPRQKLINRFNAAIKAVNRAAKDYTVEDLLNPGYIKEKILCPKTGFSLAVLLATKLDPKMFLMTAKRLRDCGREQYAMNLCKPCYTSFGLEPNTSEEFVEVTRQRQKDYATTDNGRAIRRNYARRRLLMPSIERITKAGFEIDPDLSNPSARNALVIEQLLADINVRFEVEGEEAIALLSGALKRFYRENPVDGGEADSRFTKWLSALNLNEAIDRFVLERSVVIRDE